MQHVCYVVRPCLISKMYSDNLRDDNIDRTKNVSNYVQIVFFCLNVIIIIMLYTAAILGNGYWAPKNKSTESRNKNGERESAKMCTAAFCIPVAFWARDTAAACACDCSCIRWHGAHPGRRSRWSRSIRTKCVLRLTLNGRKSSKTKGKQRVWMEKKRIIHIYTVARLNVHDIFMKPIGARTLVQLAVRAHRPYRWKSWRNLAVLERRGRNAVSPALNRRRRRRRDSRIMHTWPSVRCRWRRRRWRRRRRVESVCTAGVWMRIKINRKKKKNHPRVYYTAREDCTRSFCM